MLGLLNLTVKSHRPVSFIPQGHCRTTELKGANKHKHSICDFRTLENDQFDLEQVPSLIILRLAALHLLKSSAPSTTTSSSKGAETATLHSEKLGGVRWILFLLDRLHYKMSTFLSGDHSAHYFHSRFFPAANYALTRVFSPLQHPCFTIYDVQQFHCSLH